MSVDTLAAAPGPAAQVPRGDRGRPAPRPASCTSTRGATRRLRLAARPPQISLGDVFRAVDGPLAEVRGLRPHETSYEGVAEHLPTVWVAVRASLREVLDGTSLERRAHRRPARRAVRGRLAERAGRLAEPLTARSARRPVVRGTPPGSGRMVRLYPSGRGPSSAGPDAYTEHRHPACSPRGLAVLTTQKQETPQPWPSRFV